MNWYRKRAENLSFNERVINVALTWGLPIVAFELYQVGDGGLLIGVLIAVPSAAAGVVTVAVLEHALFSYLNKRKQDKGRSL